MGRFNGLTGTIYIVHFDQPYKGCSHYLGLTFSGLENKMHEHREGRRSGLVYAAYKTGISYTAYELARLPSEEAFEKLRSLKRRKCSRLFCPACLANKKEGAYAGIR